MKRAYEICRASVNEQIFVLQGSLKNRREKDIEILLNEIIVENFPSFERYLDIRKLRRCPLDSNIKRTFQIL